MAFVQFHLDLTAHETRRRAEVLAAVGNAWDPVVLLNGEADAEALLYSGLDPQQTAIYNDLTAAGVL